MAIKKIDKETEITIVNGRHGGFFYKSQTGDLIIDMTDFGDEDSVTYGQLKQMLSRNRNLLKEMTLIISSVEDEKITLEDVITSLKLTDSYNELMSLLDEKLDEVDYIDITKIDEFIQESSAEKIGSILGSKKSKVRYIVAESATELYKENNLTDYNKMKVVAEDLGHSNIQSFWEDIERSNK